jgi:hypothetical protein
MLRVISDPSLSFVDGLLKTDTAFNPSPRFHEARNQRALIILKGSRYMKVYRPLRVKHVSSSVIPLLVQLVDETILIFAVSIPPIR